MTSNFIKEYKIDMKKVNDYEAHCEKADQLLAEIGKEIEINVLGPCVATYDPNFKPVQLFGEYRNDKKVMGVFVAIATSGGDERSGGSVNTRTFVYVLEDGSVVFEPNIASRMIRKG